MKKCDNCSIEFEPKHKTRGTEQKYCSIKCRQSAAQTRMINKIKENAKQENKQENQNETISTNRGYQQSMDRGYEREYAPTSSGVGIIPNSHLATIKELYEAKNETIFYQLKCENLEKEINEMKIELHNLEQELEKIDEGEEESGYSGMLGGVMEQFKQDPLNTINFATELIGNLFKPKTNERTVKS
jgi:hypothetical protein